MDSSRLGHNDCRATMEKQPNVLLIVADELRADALSAYGNPVCRTPNLDRMAAAGVRFADCVVTQPTCTPSRASILTGAFPSVLKTRMVGCHTPDDPRFLGHGLQRAGYRCASIGKIHLVPQRVEPGPAARRDGRRGIRRLLRLRRGGPGQRPRRRLFRPRLRGACRGHGRRPGSGESAAAGGRTQTVTGARTAPFSPARGVALLSLPG